MARSDGFIEVAYSADTENFLPSVVLLEYLKHLVLPDNLGQNPWIFNRRDAQQQTVIVFVKSEEIKTSRVGQQRTIIKVHVIINLIIGSVEFSCTLQEFGLSLIAPVSEHLYRLFCRYFEAFHRHMSIDNLLHALANAVYIGLFYRVTKLQIDVIAIGNRDIYDDITLGIKVVNSLTEHEKQCPCVVARS